MSVALSQVTSGPEDASRWRGELSLVLAPRGERTVVVRRRHRGPFVVQSPFHPEGPVCHLVLLHPPGGIVGGDVLALDARVEPGGHALLTTPAATKVYRSAGPQSDVTQSLAVAADAALEWLPQETIAFDRARVRLSTRVDLEPGARYIGWEVACLGRPACGEVFASGSLAQSFDLWRDGQPLLLDRADWQGGSPALSAPWGLGGHPVTATLLATPFDEDAVALARDAIDAMAAIAPGRAGASVVDGVLVCRHVGPCAFAARALLAAVWGAVRPPIMGRPACAPRIWST